MRSDWLGAVPQAVGVIVGEAAVHAISIGIVVIVSAGVLLGLLKWLRGAVMVDITDVIRNVTAPDIEQLKQGQRDLVAGQAVAATDRAVVLTAIEELAEGQRLSTGERIAMRTSIEALRTENRDQHEAMRDRVSAIETRLPKGNL